MKGLYIECKMGAAGDMLTAALLELLSEHQREEAIKTLQNLGLDGVEFSTEKMVKCGIQGTHMHVHINGEEEESHDAHLHEHSHEEAHHHDNQGHEHSHNEHHHEHEEHEHSHHHHHEHHKLSDVVSVIGKLKVSPKVQKNAIEVYNLIAQAESHAHGVEIDQIHFHEVGNKDAIMDVTAVCYLMDLLGAEKIIASPIHVGSGSVRCAHGIMPVPAPATEYLLRGIPYYQGEIKSELCTPTGAALIKYFAQDFRPQPMMKVEQVGIGCGKKDFAAANCVRIFMGEMIANSLEDKIIQLDANIDDMTAEEIGFATNRLFDAGAREVFTSSVYMKKNRPGTLITVICSVDKKDQIVETFFKHTTTIGIREKICDRYILKREASVKKTSLGDVRIKTSTGYGTTTTKYEYDDLSKIALENNMSIREVRAIIESN
ncbi:MAG: nickel pincer cofactor biosynthesis protein LarC [Treponema sp.]|nr:nickel pincer cofactor biosynthesis protein LarC [Treponema sp.]